VFTGHAGQLNVFCRASNFPFSFPFSPCAPVHWARAQGENGKLLALLKKFVCQLNKKIIKLKLAQGTQNLRAASLNSKSKLEFNSYFIQILVLHTRDKITFLFKFILVGFMLFTAMVVMMSLC